MRSDNAFNLSRSIWECTDNMPVTEGISEAGYQLLQKRMMGREVILQSHKWNCCSIQGGTSS